MRAGVCASPFLHDFIAGRCWRCGVPVVVWDETVELTEIDFENAKKVLLDD